jgi:hypothetical protein
LLCGRDVGASFDQVAVDEGGAGAIVATGHYQHTPPVSVSVPAVSDPGVHPAPSGTPPLAPSIQDATSAPATPPVRTPRPGPAPTPEPEPARDPVPSPAVVAARITGADTTSSDGSPIALRAPARAPSPRPRTTDTTPAKRLAAPAPDTSVTAPEPAQPATPTVVAPLKPALPAPPVVAADGGDPVALAVEVDRTVPGSGNLTVGSVALADSDDL